MSLCTNSFFNFFHTFTHFPLSCWFRDSEPKASPYCFAVKRRAWRKATVCPRRGPPSSTLLVNLLQLHRILPKLRGVGPVCCFVYVVILIVLDLTHEIVHCRPNLELTSLISCRTNCLKAYKHENMKNRKHTHIYIYIHYIIYKQSIIKYSIYSAISDPWRKMNFSWGVGGSQKTVW